MVRNYKWHSYCTNNRNLIMFFNQIKKKLNYDTTLLKIPLGIKFLFKFAIYLGIIRIQRTCVTISIQKRISSTFCLMHPSHHHCAWWICGAVLAFALQSSRTAQMVAFYSRHLPHLSFWLRARWHCVRLCWWHSWDNYFNQIESRNN